MNLKIIAFLGAWLCFALNVSNAQTATGKIAGVVYEKATEPAIAATVTLKHLPDSTVVKTIYTDVAGKFAFDNLPYGSYVIQLSAVGFKTYKSAVVPVSAANNVITIPPITFTVDDTQLKQVEVLAQRDIIEQKIDRTVVNVGASISSTGASALEILEKMPGVLIDQNGGITFKGKTGIMVMIDDKPTYLSGDNLANYLRSIPASQLDQIELIPNPPARYDAAGNAGIINIKTKKSLKAGFNGTISAALGKAAYPYTNQSIALNYRVGKFNFFANAAYNLQNYYRRLDLVRNYFDAAGNQTSSYTELAFFHPLNHNPNIKIGLDYDLSPKTTIGFALNGVLSLGRNANPVFSTLRNGTGDIDSNIVADNYTKSNYKNGGINLNYLHKFNDSGKSLSIDLNYIKYDNTRSQVFKNTSYNKTGTPAEFQHIIDTLPVTINIYTAKADYTHPLKNKLNLSVGTKVSFVNTDNAANYYNVVGSIQTVDNNRTNSFIYKENIQAAYVNINKEWNRFSFQAGLRLEHTNVTGHQLGNARSRDSSFVNNYNSPFPTAYLSYKIDTAGHHSLNASYGRRIDRPYYQDLNPFVVVLDKYSAFVGNPFLRPQYANNYQLTYNYKRLLSVGLVYTLINSYQVEHDYQLGSIFFASTINLGEMVSTGINANVNFNPAKWWNINIYAQVYNNRYEGQLASSYLNVARTFYYGTTTSQLTFGKGWGAEITGFYQSPNIGGQFAIIARSQVNIGIQKKVLSNKGAIKLTVRDAFRGNFSAGQINNLANATATFRNDNASRLVVLGFSYSFGSLQNNQKKHDTTGADTEAGRVKN